MRRSAAHRFTSLMLLICTCAWVIPFRVSPHQLESADNPAPYPCQFRSCGCSSAEECWKHCCCFTNVQKVEWAEQHGLELPDYVHEAAAVEVQLASADSEESESGRSRCSHCSPQSSVARDCSQPSSRPDSGRHSECDEAENAAALSANSCCQDTIDSDVSAPTGTANAFVIEKLKCGGLDLAVGFFPLGLYHRPTLHQRTTFSLASPPGDDRLRLLLRAPPEPPPRLG